MKFGEKEEEGGERERERDRNESIIRCTRTTFLRQHDCETSNRCSYLHGSSPSAIIIIILFYTLKVQAKIRKALKRKENFPNKCS